MSDKAIKPRIKLSYCVGFVAITHVCLFFLGLGDPGGRGMEKTARGFVLFVLIVWIPPVIAFSLRKKSRVKILYWSLGALWFPFAFWVITAWAILGKREEWEQ